MLMSSTRPGLRARARRLRPLAAVLSLALVLCVCASPAAAQSPRRIIFDTDPGTDDALALLLALNSPEVRVEAITVVPGNVTGEQGYENARRLVSFAKRCDIPVVAGAKRPLAQRLVTAEFVHGANGLGDIELPASTCPSDARFAPAVIVELIKAHPHEITLVPIGPLTNIALALAMDPGIAGLVKEVVIMGGAVTDGNVTPVAEANIYGDPEAAAAVFSAGWPLTMVGLDVTHKTLFTPAHLAKLQQTKGPQNDLAARVLAFLIKLEAKFGTTGTPMHDPLAMGVVLDPTFVKTKAMRVDVEL
ncbi:MAG: nucleoside hydrolase, partial [Vicinamibacterales bacterium]